LNILRKTRIRSVGSHSSPHARWRRLLGEPTLQFALLGALLFAVYPWLSPKNNDRSAADRSRPEVVVDAGRVRSLVEGWTEEWERPPTPSELDGLVAEEVRTEILAREAARQGLDREDAAIRTLLREKMELIAEHQADIGEPAPKELEAFYETRKKDFGGGPTVSFSQVLLDPAHRGPAAAGDAQAMLAQLRGVDNTVDPATMGDPSALAGQYVGMPEGQVASLLGPEFVQELATLRPGVWSGPITSAYGLHLVLLAERVEGTAPPLSEVQDVVREEWRAAKARDADYQRLRDRYSVIIERPAPVTAANGTGDAGGPP
jgi:hypothetical protein